MGKRGGISSVIDCFGEENKNPLHCHGVHNICIKELFLNLRNRFSKCIKFNSEAAKSREANIRQKKAVQLAVENREKYRPTVC